MTEFLAAATGLLRETLLVTAFVAAMMLLVEYANVRTRGAWRRVLAGRQWTQYFLAGLLGVTPGCLGAFSVVTLYSHGVVSFGAVVAAMIASSGDEAFVMLALIPRTAALLFAILLVLGVAAGALADALRRKGHWAPEPCPDLSLHAPDECEGFPRGRIVAQWRNCTATRGILAAALALYGGGLASGQLGPAGWSWIRGTLLLVCAAALFVAATVPDHFLESHLWNHVARGHAPRVFLWTLAALAAAKLLTGWGGFVPGPGWDRWLLLLAACAAGLIPESGPHLVFVTLYAAGALPFAALLANSIVQDGHGMLPLLAHSRRAFIRVKAVNFLVGLGTGAVLLALAKD